MTNDTVDLFAGPGGWSVATAALGLTETGIEWDAHAVATARAAGHQRAHMDVTDADPRGWINVPLFIASPPCQAFSAAGQGLGRAAIGPLTGALAALHAGRSITEVREMVNAACHDPRAALVLEPMHWILTARPRNVALEQVPPVLLLWQAMAVHMRALGYSVDVGVLSAEQYDVPQTRKRAILIASLDREVALPAPVRAAYRKGKDPDPTLPRWLSMADALGWGGAAIRSNYGTGGDPAARGERTSEEPAATVTSKVDRNLWQFRQSAMANATVRDVATEPAPTITAGHDSAERVWTGRPDWTRERPATTVQGDPRLGRPGHKHRGPDCCGAGVSESMFAEESVRVSVAEASVLQGFPADYPWQGPKTAQYRQVGDAVPPPLAWHVLRAVLGLDVQEYPR